MYMVCDISNDSMFKEEWNFVYPPPPKIIVINNKIIIIKELLGLLEPFLTFFDSRQKWG